MSLDVHPTVTRVEVAQIVQEVTVEQSVNRTSVEVQVLEVDVQQIVQRVDVTAPGTPGPRGAAGADGMTGCPTRLLPGEELTIPARRYMHKPDDNQPIKLGEGSKIIMLDESIFRIR